MTKPKSPHDDVAFSGLDTMMEIRTGDIPADLLESLDTTTPETQAPPPKAPERPFNKTIAMENGDIQLPQRPAHEEASTVDTIVPKLSPPTLQAHTFPPDTVPLPALSTAKSNANSLTIATEATDKEPTTQGPAFLKKTMQAPLVDFVQLDELTDKSGLPHDTTIRSNANILKELVRTKMEVGGADAEAPKQAAATTLPRPPTTEVTAEVPPADALRLGKGASELAELTREFRLPLDLARKEEDAFVGRTFGNFRILQQIGKGGFGNVYKVEHLELRQQVALKVLHVSQQTQPQIVERFQREAQAMARLNHDNIVRFYDFGALEDVGFYLVMEYLKGDGLDELLSPTALWSLQRIQALIGPLCDALACVHSYDLVHRDVKPSNIVLCQAPQDDANETESPTYPLVKLLDFGIVGLMDGSSELTSAGTFLGTAQYVAPEQARGLDNVDARADIYSLGVILFRLLTGQLPYDATSQMDIVIKHIHQPIPTLAESASWKSWCDPLEDLLQRALAKEPAQRHPDIQTFKDMCSAALVAQSNFEREGRTVIDATYDYASQGNLSAYVADHGELPGASSSTMHFQLSNDMVKHFKTISPFAPTQHPWRRMAILALVVGLFAALLYWLWG